MTSTDVTIVRYSHVLDTSAVMAVLNSEIGGDVVLPLLGQSVISSVNWAEVVSLATTGRFRDPVTGQARDDVLAALLEAKDLLEHFGLSTANFTTPEAELTGLISPLTSPLGLSLGDRACLSLGLSLDLPVLTAERNWLRLDLGAEVQLIR